MTVPVSAAATDVPLASMTGALGCASGAQFVRPSLVRMHPPEREAAVERWWRCVALAGRFSAMRSNTESAPMIRKRFMVFLAHSDRSGRMRRLLRRGRQPSGFAAGTMLRANARTQRVLALALANDAIPNVRKPTDGSPESTRA